MANLFKAVWQTMFFMTAVTSSVAGARQLPLTQAEAATLAAICSENGLMCTERALRTALSQVHRDPSINTINDLQKDFFLESALMVGGQMTLHDYLRDAAPRKALLDDESASKLPPLTSTNTAALVTHFGLNPHSDMATATATATHLCGYGALPGEKMSCAASVRALRKFLATELGSKLEVMSTSGTPAVSPTQNAPVTVAAFTKGSVAQGQKIVVCHVVKFPSLLFYCHRVTGTKVITATLKTEGGAAIQAVGVCHIDTSLWLSTHPAFRALRIPRGDEACHWLEDSDLLFLPAGAGSTATAKMD